MGAPPPPAQATFPTITSREGSNTDPVAGGSLAGSAVQSQADGGTRPKSLLSSALQRRSGTSRTGSQSRRGSQHSSAAAPSAEEPIGPGASAPTTPGARSSGGSSSVHAGPKLSDLASFEIDLELDVWQKPADVYAAHDRKTLYFTERAVEDEYLRFQMRTASPLAVAAGVLALLLSAVQYMLVATSLYGALGLMVAILFALVSAAAIALLYQFETKRSEAANRAEAAASPVGGDGTIPSTDFFTERLYATRHELVSAVAMGVAAFGLLFHSGAAEELCGRSRGVESDSGAWIEKCRYRVHATPLVVTCVCLLVFRVRFTHQAAFIVAAGLFSGLGVLRFDGGHPLPGLQVFLLFLAHFVLGLATLPIAAMRERAMRTRFILLVDVFITSSALETHQENIWSIVRAVVPPMVLPRVRIAATGQAARVVDASEHGVVSVAAVHNFGAWSMSLLPFNVVLSLSRLFIEFDRCLANVDAAVSGKAMITGDRYIVVGGVTSAAVAVAAASHLSNTGSPNRSMLSDGDSASPRRNSTASSPGASPRRVASPSDLLVAVDVAEEQVRLGAALARQSPDVCGNLCVAVGISAGEVHAGIAGRTSLRYLVAGPAVEEAVRMLDAAGAGKVATTGSVRDAIESRFPGEMDWQLSDASFGCQCYEATRQHRRAHVPGLHNMVLGVDLVDESAGGRNAVGLLAVSPAISDDGRPPLSGLQLPAPAMSEGDGDEEGAQEQWPAEHVLLPSAALHGPLSTEPSQQQQQAAVSPRSNARSNSEPIVAMNIGSSAMSPDADAGAGPRALSGSSHRHASMTSALMSQSSLISTATAEHRVHVADDHALESALLQATEMLQRDPCSGRFVHPEVEEALMRFAASDDKSFGALRTSAGVIAVAGIALLFVADSIAMAYSPWEAPGGGGYSNDSSIGNITTAPAAPNATSMMLMPANTESDDNFGLTFIQGIALMVLGLILVLLQFTLAWRGVLLPTLADVVLSGIASLCMMCAALLSPGTLVTVTPGYMIPLLAFCILMTASRWPWMATAATVVVALGIPIIGAHFFDAEGNTAQLVFYFVATCIIFGIAAAATMWLLRSRFSAVLLAGEFLQLSRQRFAIREELLKGLLPSHVIGPVGETADMPEEVRLMAERPHFLEVWEELVVLQIRFTAADPRAPAASTSVAQSLGPDVSPTQTATSGADHRAPNDFDISVARLRDIQDAIATATADPAAAGLLDVVEVVGATAVVAGCVLPIKSTPHFADPHMRAQAAARAAVRFCQSLSARCKERADSFVAVGVTESGYGAILGSQLLNYCVLGVARRTAATLHSNMPDFTPPGSQRDGRSLAFVLDSFRRLCYRRRDGALLPSEQQTAVDVPSTAFEGTMLSPNPFQAVGATDDSSPEGKRQATGGGRGGGWRGTTEQLVAADGTVYDPFGHSVRCGVRGVGSVELFPITLDGGASNLPPGAVP